MFEKNIEYYPKKYAKTLLLIPLWNIMTSGGSWSRCYHGDVTIHGCLTRRCCDPREPRTSTECYKKLWVYISRMSSHYCKSCSCRPQEKMTTLRSSHSPWDSLKRSRIQKKHYRYFTFFMRTSSWWDYTTYLWSPPCNDPCQRTRYEEDFSSDR